MNSDGDRGSLPLFVCSSATLYLYIIVAHFLSLSLLYVFFLFVWVAFAFFMESIRTNKIPIDLMELLFVTLLKLSFFAALIHEKFTVWYI